jgi:hypothetical protein
MIAACGIKPHAASRATDFGGDADDVDGGLFKLLK